MNSKEFDKNLQLDNFEYLEEQYQKTKEFFSNLNEKITCDEVKQKFPAFCYCNQEIRIKFPTYFIRIIDNQISCSDLKNLLANQGKFYICKETNVIKISTFKYVDSLAVYCLETSLKKNEELAKKIENLLKQKNIISERCISSGDYIMPIKIDNGYITIK